MSRSLALALGLISVLIALYAEDVLSAIFLAYGFMAAGLFVPAVAGLLWKRATAAGAFWSMTTGGSLTILIHVMGFNPFSSYGLDVSEASILLALPVAGAIMVVVSLLGGGRQRQPEVEASSTADASFDVETPSGIGTD